MQELFPLPHSSLSPESQKKLMELRNDLSQIAKSFSKTTTEPLIQFYTEVHRSLK